MRTVKNLYGTSNNSFGIGLGGPVIYVGTASPAVTPPTPATGVTLKNGDICVRTQTGSEGFWVMQSSNWVEMPNGLGGTFNGDVIIDGSLTVTGTTTTVNTTTLSISDPVITLNNGETGAGVTLGEAGFEVDRGSLPNTYWLWNEGDSRWEPTGPGATQNLFIGGNITASHLNLLPSIGFNSGYDVVQMITGTKPSSGAFNANSITVNSAGQTTSNGLYPVNAFAVSQRVGFNGTTTVPNTVRGRQFAQYASLSFESPTDPTNVGIQYGAIEFNSNASSHDNGRHGTLTSNATTGNSSVVVDSTTAAGIVNGDWIAITLDNGVQFTARAGSPSGTTIPITPTLPSDAGIGNAVFYPGGVRGTLRGIGGRTVLSSGSTDWLSNANEINFAVQTGASAYMNAGLNAVLGGTGLAHNVQGKAWDFGIGVSATSAAAVGLRDAFLVHPGNGAHPLDTTNGTVLRVAGFPSFKNGIDLTQVTAISGNAFMSPGATISGTGAGAFTGLSTIGGGLLTLGQDGSGFHMSTTRPNSSTMNSALFRTGSNNDWAIGQRTGNSDLYWYSYSAGGGLNGIAASLSMMGDFTATGGLFGNYLDITNDFNGDTTMLLSNLSTGASSNAVLHQEAGGRRVTRNVSYTGQYIHEFGINIATKYSDFDLHYWRKNDQTNLMRLTSVGFLGVGAVVPTVRVTLQNDVGTAGNANGIRIYDNTAGAINGLGTSNGQFDLRSVGAFVYYTGTGPTEIAKLDQNGNFGVGASTVLARIHSKGLDGNTIGLFAGTTRAIRITTNTVGTSIEGVDITGSASYQPLYLGGSYVGFTTSNVERARIDAAGRLLVNATSFKTVPGANYIQAYGASGSGIWSIAGAGESSIGVYSEAVGYVGLYMAAANGMTVFNTINNAGGYTGSPMTVTANAVGVGTNSASTTEKATRFAVMGNTTATNEGVMAVGNNGFSRYMKLGVIDAGGNQRSYIQAYHTNSDSNPWQLVLNPYGGFVGVGIDSPGYVFHVRANQANSYPFVIQSHDNLVTGFYVYEDASKHFAATINNGANTSMVQLATNGPSYFKGGAVGIGGDPIYLLDVLGSLNSSVTSRIANGSTGNSAQSTLMVDLSAVAFAYGQFGIYKNSGNPYGFLDMATGVTGGFRILSQNNFQIFLGGVGIVHTESTSFGPYTDNVISAGRSGQRYTVVYAATGTISTSDANHKTDIRDPLRDELDFFLELSRNVRVFRYIDAVAKKGSAARKHIGVIAQQVIEIAARHNIDALEYGFVGIDPVLEDGVDTGKVIYSIRADELLFGCIAALSEKLTASSQ